MKDTARRSSSRSPKLTKLRARFAIPAFVLALVALALPAGAAAEPLESFTSYTSFPNAGGSPYSVTPGPDGNMWFANPAIPSIGKITPSGTVTEYTGFENAGASPVSITKGPDGNLWFASEGSTPAIGKITTAGVITEFELGLSPSSITKGPDGNLWFTIPSTSEPAIGKITTVGEITEYSEGLIPEIKKPVSITAGPDGNLWFSVQGTGQGIGRITTSGTITEFSTSKGPGVAGIRSPSIIGGPDGNVWFTIEVGGIGRITPSGTITEFTSGLQAGKFPVGITAGSDGNLWFTDLGEFEGGEEMVGRITPTGTITEYPTPGVYPLGIAPGQAGEGNIWLADFITPAIDKFGIEEEAGPKFPTALTVSKTGEGTITSSPKGIECGGTCSHSYEKGESVTLTASPASGYAFNSWAGCTEHVGLTCKVTMAKAITVKASFIATPSLTIEKAGSGQGKASATGISCDENCSKATSAIKTGTSVTVKVASAKGSQAASFEGGTGSASGCSGATCTFTISADSSVVVKFDAAPTKTLTVNLTGPAAYKGKVTGKGTVKGLTASAISCGSGCTTQTESFFASDTVTLTAVAGTGYKFAGWSGSEAGTCTGTTSPCTISTSANKTLSAEFK